MSTNGFHPANGLIGDAAAAARRAAYPSPATAAAALKLSAEAWPSMAPGRLLSFEEAIHLRRSIYKLDRNPPISDDQLLEVIKDVMHQVPSSFNIQSTRVVVLLHEEHSHYWDIVEEVLQPQMTVAEERKKNSKRMAMFRDAYATILFFEDPAPIKAAESKYPFFAHYFDSWSEHTSGMHQYAMWVALSAVGYGVNLQHYNPIVDRRAKEKWGIHKEWRHVAQLVIGGRVEDRQPDPKEKLPIDQLVYVRGR